MIKRYCDRCGVESHAPDMWVERYSFAPLNHYSGAIVAGAELCTPCVKAVCTFIRAGAAK